MTDLPDGNAWGLHGDADTLCALNDLTDERVVDAAKLIQTGRRFSLDRPIKMPSPALFGRESLRHEVFRIAPFSIDDRLDSFFPQGSTQWDAFAMK